MQNTLQTLTQVSTKETIELFANKMVSEIENGEVDILAMFAQIKILSDAFDIVKEKTKNIAWDKVNELGKDQLRFGFKFETAEMGVKYDYSGCGSSAWESCKAIEDEYSSKRKDIEKALKVADKAMIVDDVTGEIIKPPLRKCTQTIKMTKLK